MIQQRIYFTDATYNRMYEGGYLGNANIIFEKALCKGEIFDIGKQSHFYIVDEDLKQRIDKAIEYIETWCYDEYSIAIKTGDKTCSSEPKAIDKLLDILKGSDKDDNR